ncbi:MAG: biotin/lipoyl-binding protein [Caulobacteraceae bacterium]
MSREIMARELTDEFPIDVPADAPLTSEQKARVRQPMIIGAVVVAVFVVGMLVWAGVSSIAEAVPAPGFVEVAVNRKTVRQLDGGVIRSILVQEGQSVHKGQPLIIFDDTQARAQLDVLQNQYDADMAQLARLEAEVSGATSVTFPPELTSRQSDPAVAKLMKSEQTLFATRLLLYQTQSRVLTQRIAQQRAREGGLQAQVKALDAQSGPDPGRAERRPEPLRPGAGPQEPAELPAAQRRQPRRRPRRAHRRHRPGPGGRRRGRDPARQPARPARERIRQRPEGRPDQARRRRAAPARGPGHARPHGRALARRRRRAAAQSVYGRRRGQRRRHPDAGGADQQRDDHQGAGQAEQHRARARRPARPGPPDRL